MKRRSLRLQLLASLGGVFALLLSSTGYTLFSTATIQNISNQSFAREKQLNQLIRTIQDSHSALLQYLSTRSSNALSQFLAGSQSLGDLSDGLVSGQKTRSNAPVREIASLIGAYLDLSADLIEAKRGRDIGFYTGQFATASKMLEFINARIDRLSITSFRQQMNQFESIIAVAGTITLWNLVFIASILALTALILWQNLQKMTVPLIGLSSMAEQIANVNFAPQDVPVSSISEIDRVIIAFNKMKADIQAYIQEIHRQQGVQQENVRMKELLQRMEIYTLQAQMNPHFLFNTLNTGMQLAIVEGAERTADYMDSMARLFRHNIRNKEIFVPLRYEVDGLRYYYQILTIRFPTQLSLTLDCPDHLLDTQRVPVSVLQPLVENCIVHAFSSVNGLWRIAVRIQRRADILYFEVEDNGCGMAGDQISELLRIKGHQSPLTKVMGLENVIQRLHFFYPDDLDCVQIRSEPGRGTCITISIPVEKEPCIAF